MRRVISFLMVHLAAVSVLLLLSGCVHRSLDAKYTGPKRGIIADRSVPAKLPVFEEKVVEKTNNYTRKEIRFSTGDTGTQMLTYFEIAATNKLPVIVISPAMGGSYWIEKRIARY